MPVRKVNGGFRWGNAGHGHKVYKSKALAMRQGRAIAISEARQHGHRIPMIRRGINKRR